MGTLGNKRGFLGTSPETEAAMF